MAEVELDHVCIQVRDLDRAIPMFTALFGYRQATRPVVNTRHRTRGVFLVKDGSLPIKLITPEDAASGPQRYGAHHLAFRTDDIDAAVAQLRSGGARLLAPPQPGEMFDDAPIAFLFAAGLDIELVTTREWRDRLPAEDRAEP